MALKFQKVNGFRRSPLSLGIAFSNQSLQKIDFRYNLPTRNAARIHSRPLFNRSIIGLVNEKHTPCGCASK